MKYLTSARFELVKDMYSEASKQGWEVALEGKVRESSKGYSIEPPIVPLLKWSDENDVVERANSLKTGLGATVWRKDVVRAERMAR